MLFRTYFWDDYAAQAAARLCDRSAGMDFFVQINETETGPLDVGPFRKLAHTVADFEKLGLPCLAPSGRPVLWWNCDYSLYDAVLKLPQYEYFFSIECDVAANVTLRPIVEKVIADGHQCLTPVDFILMEDTWAHAYSCAGLPYARRAWVPLPLMLVSRAAARYLLAERQRLGRMHADGQLPAWPISEGFFGSALLSGGYTTAPLSLHAKLPHFGSEAIYLDTDPRTRLEGTVAHSVLDAGRFWEKLTGRAFRVWLERGHYEQLRHGRESLRQIGSTEHADWRISAADGNLALDRPARQSSTSRWSRQALPRQAEPTAADARGGNCGFLTPGFGFHTELEANPWWEVDLGAACVVREIRIFNSWQVPERARRFRIDVRSDAESWREVFRKSDDRVFAGHDDPFLCRVAEPILARFVRVVLEGVGVLHLNEIEVYGEDV